MKKEYYLILFVLAVIVGITWTVFKNPELHNFKECVDAGGKIMESYPRRCRYGDKTFVEPSCSYRGKILTLKTAKEIARNSECGERLNQTYYCNNASGTYWIDLDIQKKGCDPACVVDVVNRNATINWRCNGFVPEK